MRYITLLTVLAAFAAGIPAHADELSDTGEFIDGIAAVVNEGIVLKSELRAQTEVIRQRARTEGLQLPPDDILEEQVLERLVIERIQLQRADRFGIQISDQMVNAALASPFW